MSMNSESGPLSTEEGRRALLQSIVEMTRGVFAARACSIMGHDSAARELVFEAVAGEGADTLVGQRIPDRTGLAGWSLASEEPIAVADVVHDPRFARDVAERTGYVPTAITVYPLLAGERSLGVLNVLDQGTGERVGLAEMNVLGIIAAHAASVLWLVQGARSQEGGGGSLAELEQALGAASPARRDAALGVIAALEELLSG
jgi:GAF domain-containing protein